MIGLLPERIVAVGAHPTDRRLSDGQDEPSSRRMIEDMIVRNLSPATQQSYVSAVAKFSRYFGGALRPGMAPSGLSRKDRRPLLGCVGLISI
jgi:hypothetical protein